VENCPKCNSSKTIINIVYKFHDTFDCLSCGNWWYCRIDDCCRKSYKIVAQCHKYSPNTRLYYQCTNCGGCLNRTKPLNQKLYSNEIEGPFSDEYFDDWKSQISVEQNELYEIKKNLNYRNSKKGKYDDYIISEKWRSIRKRILERDDYLCQHCKTCNATEVHHITYDNLFNENLEDLISLCNACHKMEHTQKI